MLDSIKVCVTTDLQSTAAEIYLEGGECGGFPTPEVDFPLPRVSGVYT